MPTTYIDEFGVIIDKEELKNKVYKTINYSKENKKSERRSISQNQ